MPDLQYDYLIIGQGLAGSLLAWHLLRAGQRVMVIDDGHRSSSSKVAAGLINPLAGMRFNCAPRTDQWLASAHTFYDRLGELYGRRYFHAIDMQRLFRSPEQARFYQRQLQRESSRAYLGGALSADEFDAGVRAPHGGFAQKQTGYLDMPQILADLRDWLCQHQAHREQGVDYAAIDLAAEAASVGGIQASRIVFCEGYRMRDNPWFNALPLQPDKGEFLHLNSQRRLCEHIVNGAHMLIPLAEGGYRFGATHQHKDIDDQPTTAARLQLQAGLEALLQKHDDIRIDGQLAGVRPATSDRQPFVGQHPHQSALYLFNGFGARGALSIPWHAEQFARHLLLGTPVAEEADINRYRKLL